MKNALYLMVGKKNSLLFRKDGVLLTTNSVFFKPAFAGEILVENVFVNL
jgi:hypothetical protein